MLDVKANCDHAGRIEGHTLTPPQQYCKNFNGSVCDRRWVPKGNCLWDATEGTCKTDPRCVHVATQAAGASYVFFKFHKVGSSTVASTLRLAIIGVTGDPYTGCLHKADITRKSPLEASRYKFCSLCANHDNSLPLLPAFRQPAVLAAPPELRLRTIFASPLAASVDGTCPQRASLSNKLLTGTVFRHPVDRVISKYYFMQTYCGDDARKEGLKGCAADVLDIVGWLNTNVDEMVKRELLYKEPWKVSHEVLGYTGAHAPSWEASEAALQAAKRTLDAMTVVGITERMDETMVLFSEEWQLPLAAIQSAYTSLLQNPTKRPVNESVRLAIAEHPGVKLETALYRHALHRFERQLRAVPQLAAKLAFLRSAGSVSCGLHKEACAHHEHDGGGEQE